MVQNSWEHVSPLQMFTGRIMNAVLSWGQVWDGLTKSQVADKEDGGSGLGARL